MTYAKKSLGQNFLMHARTAERIADAAALTKDDVVLEIGPGTGMLTMPLLARAKKVIAIEADRELVPELRKKFSGEIGIGLLDILEGDVRAFDPSSIGGEYKLVANIPYYLTGEIIRSFLEAAHPPRSMTLLVQKEVAERIARDKKGSVLAMAVKAFGTPKYCFTVPRGAFKPAPGVDSAVLHVDLDAEPFASPEAMGRYFEVLKAGFAHKRKLVAGNLGVLADANDVSYALKSAGIDLKARPEELSVEQWRLLTRYLSPLTR